MERTKVENPFTMGPSSNRPKYQPDLQSRVSPRASFDKGISTGTYIADALVKFAGVAGDDYVKRTAKKVEADKIVQTARALNKTMPTDDATVAGYQAHAAVAIKGQMLKKQAELNALAEQNITDEQWDEAAKQAYVDVDAFMMLNYENYAKDNDLQKLTAVAMREAMPQVSAKREAAKIGYEIEGRISSATDVLVTGAKIFKGVPDDQALELVNGMLKPMKLTAQQKDSVITDAVIQSRSMELVNLAKNFKGDRSTSLYTRSGKIQKIESEIQSQEIADSSIAIAEERRAVEQSFLSGELSRDELSGMVKRRNSEIDNKFMSGSAYTKLLDDRDKILAGEYQAKAIMDAIVDPNTTEIGAEPKEIQAGLNMLIQTRTSSAIEDSKGMDDEARAKFIEDKTTQTIATIGDQSVKVGEPVKAWVADLYNFANLNVTANLVEIEDKGLKKQVLSDKAKQAVRLLDNLSDTALPEYLEALDVREAKTIRNYLHLRDMDTPEAAALQKAQTLTRNPAPVDFVAVKKGVEEVRDSQEYFWWRKDIPDNQSAYMDKMLTDKVMLDTQPASKRNIKDVSAWMGRSWTTLKNGTRLYGSPEQLSKASNLHPDRLGTAMEGYIESEKSRVLPIVGEDGMKDVFPVTNPKLNTIQLWGPSGPIPNTIKPLSSMADYAAKRKIQLDKIASDKLKDFNDRQTGGILYDKRYPKRRD